MLYSDARIRSNANFDAPISSGVYIYVIDTMHVVACSSFGPSIIVFSQSFFFHTLS